MSAPIVIIGGGPVGASLALLLPPNQSVHILEARAQGASHQDNRALALSHASRLMFEKMGIWQALSADIVPINTIHVSQTGGFGRTILRAAEHSLPSLGYIVPYGKLNAALDEKLQQSRHIDMKFEAKVASILPENTQAIVNYYHTNQEFSLKTPLAVLADGGRSETLVEGLEKTEKNYPHDALVATISAEMPHNFTAYERFTPQGPIALLPRAGVNEYGLVWTTKPAEISRLLALETAELLAELQTAFGGSVGQFLSISKPLSFPLKSAQITPKAFAQLANSHLAIIGNAAQTMHPVAGQGFNVGLRDAATLAQMIENADAALGSAAMLRAYQASRARDTRGSLWFTDFLVNAFGYTLPGAAALRGLGLGLMQISKPAKKLLVDRMSFGG